MQGTGLMAIDTSTMDQDAVFHFCRIMAGIFVQGKGRPPQVAARLETTPAFPLRVLFGIPRAELTTAQMRFAEAVFCHAFDQPYGPRPEIWTDSPNFRPVNPAASRGNGEALNLDLGFMERFGLPWSVWDKEIFITDGLVKRAMSGRMSENDLLRAEISLAMVGVSEPWQFFRPNPLSNSNVKPV